MRSQGKLGNSGEPSASSREEMPENTGQPVEKMAWHGVAPSSQLHEPETGYKGIGGSGVSEGERQSEAQEKGGGQS
jgi:hypothetical protein